MWNAIRILFFLLALAPIAAFAGPAEDTKAAVEHWATAFNSNDADAVSKLYAPDATLLGTISPVVTEGREGIHDYFARAFSGAASRGGRAKVEITELHSMGLGDNALLGTGFYKFAMGPARFTMVFIKQGNDWLIAHHHSSRKPETPQ
jgi:uncharacterized protein (TIGR02246 family)